MSSADVSSAIEHEPFVFVSDAPLAQLGHVLATPRECAWRALASECDVSLARITVKKRTFLPKRIELRRSLPASAVLFRALLACGGTPLCAQQPCAARLLLVVLAGSNRSLLSLSFCVCVGCVCVSFSTTC